MLFPALNGSIVFDQFANIKPFQLTCIVQSGTSGVVFDSPIGTVIQQVFESKKQTTSNCIM